MSLQGLIRLWRSPSRIAASLLPSVNLFQGSATLYENENTFPHRELPKISITDCCTYPCGGTLAGRHVKQEPPPTTVQHSVEEFDDGDLFMPWFFGFSSDFVKKLAKHEIVVVCFTSEECKPCMVIRQNLLDLLKTYREKEKEVKVDFLRVNIYTCTELAAVHDIRCLPTFCCYYQARLMGTVEGAHVGKLGALVKSTVEHVKNKKVPS